MTNLTIFLAIAMGAAVAFFAWLAAFFLTRDGRWTDSAKQLLALERMKFVLVAVLALITIGLAIVVSNVSDDIHNLKSEQTN